MLQILPASVCLAVIFAVCGPAPAAQVDLAASGGNDDLVRIDGAQAGDRFGEAVATLDFNGDGYTDLAIGAQGVDVRDPQGNLQAGNAGAVYVVYGGPNTTFDGLDPAALLTANGGDGTLGFVLLASQPSEQLGSGLAAAGDINHDGIEDLVIGSPNYVGSVGRNGGAYVIFGRPPANAMPAEFALTSLRTADGSNSGFGVVLQGSQNGGGVGTDVAGVGDINGDGLDDLVLGNSYAAAGQGGVRPSFTFVLYGREDTASWPDFVNLVSLQTNIATGAEGFSVLSDASQNGLGRVVTQLGDFDGDGHNDFFLGSPLAASSSGIPNSAGFIVPGRTSGPGQGFDTGLDLTLGINRDTTYRLLGDNNDDNSGVAAAGIGDINGDGRPDLAVAANQADHGGENSGSVYVLFGRVATAPLRRTFELSQLLAANGGNGSAGFVLTGSPGLQLGDAVSGLGDFNGDGHDDFLVGARFADLGGADAGAGYVVYGRSGFPAQVSVTSLEAENGAAGFVLVGEQPGDQAGGVLGAAADMDGDGASELIIAAHLADVVGSNAGRVYALEGTAPPAPALTGAATRAWFDPQRAGEGVLTEVGTLDGQPVLFVTWYTYVDGEQLWLAGGPQPFAPGASEVALELLMTSGAGFGDEFAAGDVSSQVWGQVVVSLLACDLLGWRYIRAGDQLAGSAQFVPLLANQLALPGCDPASDSASATAGHAGGKGLALDRSFAGTWWNPARAGEGIVIDLELRGATPTAFFSWFTYYQGAQRWLVGSAPFDPSTAALQLPLVFTRGTGFGPGYAADDVVIENFGTATLQFNGCNGADLSYSGAFAPMQTLSGTISLERFTSGLYQQPCSR